MRLENNNSMTVETKAGMLAGYLVSGSTAAVGVAAGNTAAFKPHIIYGFSLNEIALMFGIAGTCATVVFQYLNYRRNKKNYK
jgi:hypothetical protein